MTKVEVTNTEANRIDLLLIRTMGSDTGKNRIYFHFFNPQLDYTNMKAGTVVNIPNSEEMRKINSPRCYFINSYKEN